MVFVVALFALGVPVGEPSVAERLSLALGVLVLWLPLGVFAWWVQSRGLEVSSEGVRITTFIGATEPVPWSEMSAAIISSDELEGSGRVSGCEWVVVGGDRSSQRPVSHLVRSKTWADFDGMAINRWAKASFEVASAFEPLVERLNLLAVESRNAT